MNWNWLCREGRRRGGVSANIDQVTSNVLSMFEPYKPAKFALRDFMAAVISLSLMYPFDRFLVGLEGFGS